MNWPFQPLLPGAARIQGGTITSSFTLNAVFRKGQSASFTLDAALVRTQTATFTLDAVINRGGSFTLNAVLKKGQTATFPLDSALRKTFSSSFTLNAVLTRTTFQVTLNAVLKANINASLTLDSVLALGPHFRLDAVIKRAISASFTLNAVIRERVFTLNAALTIVGPPKTPPLPGTTPGGSPVPPPGSVAPGQSVINVFIGNSLGGGLTDFAQHMVYSRARFESQVNGSPGTASFHLKDLPGTMTVLPGQDVTLVINGQVIWRGFISSIRRVYMFPAINAALWGTKRIYKIEAVDQNILFRRRFVFNQNSPEDVAGTEFPVHTPDTVVLKDLFDNFIDLSGDDIDVTTFVENVADINFDLKARILSASMSWGDTMRAVASMPGAIFYLLPNLGNNPRAYLVYTDVDTPTAPYALSDVPNGTTIRSYQGMEILFDGSSLANDVMAWGFGYGNASPVFTRAQDAASIADHGRWQRGEKRYGIWKQGSIERAADSIVYGSPLNRRGAKDDRPAIEITVFETGLLPSQKVDFTSEVFGFNDVIPVRRMVVTFEAPAVPKFQLTLSHEIDLPNAPIDPMPFGFPPFPPLPPFPPFPPIPPFPPSPNCRITDEFDRTVTANQSSAGTATCGLTWNVTDVFDLGDSVGVAGGVMTINVVNQIEHSLGPIYGRPDWSMRWKQRWNTSGILTRQRLIFANVMLDLFRDFQSPSTSNVRLTNTDDSSFTNGVAPMVAGNWYDMVLYWVNGTAVFTAYDEGQTEATQPGGVGGVTIVVPMWDTSSTSLLVNYDFMDSPGSDSVSWRMLDIAGTDFCTVQQQIGSLAKVNSSQLYFVAGDSITADPGYSVVNLGLTSDAPYTTRTQDGVPFGDGAYVEMRQIHTFQVSPGVTIVRIRAHLQLLGPGGGAGGPNEGITEFPVSYRLAKTTWDYATADPTSSGGWEPNGSTLLEGTVMVPIEPPDGLMLDLDDLIVPVSGETFQLHLTCTSPTGASLKTTHPGVFHYTWITWPWVYGGSASPPPGQFGNWPGAFSGWQLGNPANIDVFPIVEGLHPINIHTVPGWIREAIDAVGTVATLYAVPAPDSVKVYVGGVLQTTPTNYTLNAAARTLTFTTPPLNLVDVTYYAVGSA